jgi:hypothetical protein
LALALFVLAAFSSPALGAAEPKEADPEAAFQKAVNELDIQTCLESPTCQSPPRKSINLRLPKPLAYILGIILLAVVLNPVIRSVYERLRKPKEEELEEPDSESEKSLVSKDALAKVRESAESLAAAGRYGEAAHALLLQTIELLKSAKKVILAPSLTSREIAAKLRLSNRQAGCLGLLIGKVEPAWFGLKPAAESDYLECRAAYEVLAGALSGGGGYPSQAPAGPNYQAPEGPAGSSSGPPAPGGSAPSGPSPSGPSPSGPAPGAPAPARR